MLLLSSARVVRAMACANHSLQSYFFQKEFFGELIAFRHLNLNLTIFFNAILSDLSKLSLRGCLHDTGATFDPQRVHSGSLSWLYTCLHDTTTKCHAGASHPGVNSPRFLYRGENFTPVRNFATVSCKRETTTRFGVKSVCR